MIITYLCLKDKAIMTKCIIWIFNTLASFYKLHTALPAKGLQASNKRRKLPETIETICYIYLFLINFSKCLQQNKLFILYMHTSLKTKCNFKQLGLTNKPTFQYQHRYHWLTYPFAFSWNAAAALDLCLLVLPEKYSSFFKRCRQPTTHSIYYFVFEFP